MTLECLQCGGTITHLRPDEEEVACPGCGSWNKMPSLSATTFTSPFRREPAREEGLSEGDRLGRFRLIERVGRGAFGAVYKALDTELGRIVALKVLHPSLVSATEGRERFFREARAAAQLRHPGIVTIHEATEIDGAPIIVSEFIDGETLATWGRGRKVPYRQAAALVAQVAEALSYAGSMGMVHRDIKPTNLMVAKSAGGAGVVGVPRIKIVDFGLALLDEAEATLTTDGQVIGTPGFMSPEQAAGRGHMVDARSDLYSLGVVLYELLCGEVPFRGSRMALIHQVLREEPRAPRSLDPTIPLDLETICLKAMAKAPSSRYATASEFADDLGRYLRREPIRARPVGPAERLVRWAARNPAVASLVSAVVILLAVIAIGGGLASIRLRRERDAVTENLWRSYLREAQALRWSGKMGRRYASLEAIAKAARIRPSLDLRNEAIACMPLVDMQPVQTIRDSAMTHDMAMVPTPDFDAVGILRGDDSVVVRSITDGSVIHRAYAPSASRPNYLSFGFSPNGRYLSLSVGEGTPNRSCIVDLVTGERFLGAPSVGLYLHSFTSDGRRASARIGRDWLGLYNVQDWSLISKIRLESEGEVDLVDPTGTVDARWLGGGHPTRLIDLSSGRTIREIDPDLGLLAWHPDGRRIALARRSHIELLDARSGRVERTLEGSMNQVIGGRFDPSGRFLATHGWDGCARLWDVGTGEALVATRGAEAFFSSDSRKVAIKNGFDLTVYELADGGEFRALQAAHAEGGGPWCFAIHPAGRLIASSHDDGVRIWDLATGRELALLPGHAGQICFAPDGSCIWSAAEKRALRWPFATAEGTYGQTVGPPEQVGPTSRSLLRLEFGPDGTRAFRVGRDSVRVVRPRGGEVLLTPHRGVSKIVISADERWILTGAQFDSSVKIWDAETGQLVRELPGDHDGGGAFSPDGRWLATTIGGQRGATNLMRVGEWEPRPIHDGRCAGLAFSPDGRMLAAVTDDPQGTVILFDTETRQEVARLTPPHPDLIGPVVFSADGNLLLTGAFDANKLEVWDLPKIRCQLRAINLDWDPPLAAAAIDSTPAPPPAIRVIAGLPSDEDALRR